MSTQVNVRYFKWRPFARYSSSATFTPPCVHDAFSEHASGAALICATFLTLSGTAPISRSNRFSANRLMVKHDNEYRAPGDEQGDTKTLMKTTKDLQNP